MTALDIDLLDLGYHLQKLLLGLFCFGIAVSILDGCQGLFIIGREAQGYSSLNLVCLSGFPSGRIGDRETLPFF